MIKVIHICDKCNYEKIYDKDAGSEFRKVMFAISKKGKPYTSIDPYENRTSKELFLCEKCQIKLGIYDDLNKEPNFYQQPELIDRVFDLFAEIADELGYIRNE